MPEEMFKAKVIYGHVELKLGYREEGNKLVCYGHSIHYDRDGKEVSRTEPEAISSMYYE